MTTKTTEQPAQPFYIVIKAKSGKRLFLADREKVRDRWWTPDMRLAVEFRSYSTADSVRKRFYYNDPKIISYQETTSQ